MPNTIRIPRSVTTNTPPSLLQGELANSEAGSPNSINELFIGIAGPGVLKLISNVGGNPAEPNDSGQDNQSLTTGLGIDGADGGSSGDFTLSFASSELATTAIVALDHVVFNDATDGLPKKALVSGIDLALFDNTAGWEANDADTVLTTSVGSASWNWIIDEDAMGSNSAAHVPTQQSVKAYVDAQVASGVIYKGAYNAATNTPDLDTTPISTGIGDMYTVTADGVFFTEQLRIGDVLICEEVNATTLTQWTIVERNLDQADETTLGIAEIATQVETDAGSDDDRIITPLKLENWPGSANLAELGTVTSGVWSGTVIASNKMTPASETVKGAIEIASQAEVDSGASAALAVTPSYLHNTAFDGGTF